MYNIGVKRKEKNKMKQTIKYTEDIEGRSVERELIEKGYYTTADCYWCQIFEDDNGNKIILDRE